MIINNINVENIILGRDNYEHYAKSYGNDTRGNLRGSREGAGVHSKDRPRDGGEAEGGNSDNKIAERITDKAKTAAADKAAEAKAAAENLSLHYEKVKARYGWEDDEGVGITRQTESDQKKKKKRLSR